MRATEKFLKEMRQYKGACRAEALLQEQELHPELRNRTIWITGLERKCSGELMNWEPRGGQLVRQKGGYRFMRGYTTVPCQDVWYYVMDEKTANDIYNALLIEYQHV